MHAPVNSNQFPQIEEEETKQSSRYRPEVLAVCTSRHKHMQIPHQFIGAKLYLSKCHLLFKLVAVNLNPLTEHEVEHLRKLPYFKKTIKTYFPDN